MAAIRRAGAALAAAMLMAACGGDRRAEAPPADQPPAATPADSGTPPDTIAPPPPAVAPTPAESGATATAPPPPQAPAKPTPRPQPKPAAPAPADTTRTAAAPPEALPSDTPLRDAYHQAPRDTVSQQVYTGWKQYNLNCSRCHGEDVLGTTIAPHLIVSLKADGPINTRELFIQTVCAGRPAKGMPAWCALGLEMDNIEAIYTYVKGRSDAKIGPGRPAVRQEG